MKSVKRNKALLLAALMIFCAVLMSACGEDKELTYEVKVTDALGTPYTSGVIVKFIGEETAMQVVNAEGVASKVLPRGEYKVELQFTSSDTSYYYDSTDMTVSAEKTHLDVVLSYTTGEAGQPIFAQGKDTQAYAVAAGCTYVKLTEGERSYFLFTPKEAGTYRFSAVGEGTQVGYYGAPHFVQELSAAEVVDNAFTISVSNSMIGTGDTGTSVLVIGVDAAAGTDGAILTIQRTGDPQRTVADEPWTEYKTTAVLSPYTLSLAEGQSLCYIDIAGKTEDYNIVFNEADGLYHFGAADGPVVLINLGKNAPNVSLQTVIQGDGSLGGAPIRKYFYDEAGNFVKKEDYTDILVNYFDNMDKEHGVYPLTSDLVYIIQNACSGWWTSTSPDYIFADCNPELGWMFALCYVK